MTQGRLTLCTLGDRLAREGAQRAADHADMREANWTDRAHGYLLEFLARHQGEFRGEHVRTFAEDRGFAKPPSNRAWGCVVQRAARRGQIRRVRFESCANPKAHSAPVSVWVRA